MGHTGAVLTVKFSHCGRLLASGSFDKSVRVWAMESGRREVMCLTEHSNSLSELSWAADSTRLLSASFDGTVKLWDVRQGQMLSDFSQMGGFVQTVMWEPSENNVFFAGSTAGTVAGFDVRTGKRCTVFENDAQVTALHVYRGGELVLSGDQHGNMRLWSTVTGTCVKEMANTKMRRPISYLHASTPVRSDRRLGACALSFAHVPLMLIAQRDGQGDSLLAVNCYDNVMRV